MRTLEEGFAVEMQQGSSNTLASVKTVRKKARRKDDASDRMRTEVARILIGYYF